MKKRNGIAYVLTALVCTLVIAVMPTDAEARIYEDTVRLHILARSDSEEDQRVKLEIRDTVLDKYGEVLTECADAGVALDVLKQLCSEIELTVEERLNELGYSYGASVEIGEEWYETREYGEFALPEGRYCSLRIILADGAGKNWWCVMFPPLCTDIATGNAPKDDAYFPYTEEEVILVNGGKYQIKFKLLELFSRAFS